MAFRSDITLDQTLEPRVIRVAAPSTALSLQDLVDTVRDLEDDFTNMSYPFLIGASGKEDLGDGVTVGITVQEQNARVAFEARRTPSIDESTVTTASGAPNLQGRYTFVDTGADFVTAGVEAGHLVVNWTDRSMADVVEVIDANTIRMEALVNGTDNEMQVSDVYSIFPVVQVRISAGNLTAVDDLLATINAVLPTAFTQVVLAQASQSTITNLDDIESTIDAIDARLINVETQTTATAIAQAVWNAGVTFYNAAGSFGNFVQAKLLTTVKFFGLR